MWVKRHQKLDSEIRLLSKIRPDNWYWFTNDQLDTIYTCITLIKVLFLLINPEYNLTCLTDFFKFIYFMFNKKLQYSFFYSLQKSIIYINKLRNNCWHIIIVFIYYVLIRFCVNDKIIPIIYGKLKVIVINVYKFLLTRYSL